jgi:hypothetical protein
MMAIVLVPLGPFNFSFPPSDPWMAFLYIIVLLFILRITLLWGPYDGLWNKYGKDRKSLWNELWRIVKATGLKGVYGLIISEILLLFTPSIIALSARLFWGHPEISWPTSQNLLVVYGAFFSVWFLIEVREIYSTRKSVNAILHSPNLLQIISLHPGVMKNVMKTFGWSREQLEDLTELGVEYAPTEPESNSSTFVKTITKFWKFHPSAIIARKATKETAKIVASKIDKKTQESFNSLLESIHSWKRVGKGFALNLVPLFAIYCFGYFF